MQKCLPTIALSSYWPEFCLFNCMFMVYSPVCVSQMIDGEKAIEGKSNVSLEHSSAVNSRSAENSFNVRFIIPTLRLNGKLSTWLRIRLINSPFVLKLHLKLFPFARYRLYYIMHIACGGFVWNPYWLSTEQLFCSWKECWYGRIWRIYSHASSKVCYCWICSW